MCMPLVHCGRIVSPTKRYIDLMSRLLSAIPRDVTVICCGGSSAYFVKVLDKNLGRKAGFQYPFNLTPFHFERLLRKPSFSVMWRIDMCSMLGTLLLRLNGLLDERWVQSTMFFRRVYISNSFFFLLWEDNFGMRFACFVGLGIWKSRVVYSVSCGAGDDHSLVSDCCIYQ